jgi:hypothetical protein
MPRKECLNLSDSETMISSECKSPQSPVLPWLQPEAVWEEQRQEGLALARKRLGLPYKPWR